MPEWTVGQPWPYAKAGLTEQVFDTPVVLGAGEMLWPNPGNWAQLGHYGAPDADGVRHLLAVYALDAGGVWRQTAGDSQ